MDVEKTLSASMLLTLATEKLEASGYSVKREFGESIFPTESSLLAEDEFGIVSFVIFETWSQLSSKWPEAQATLVQLVARKIARTSPKFFDAYLVLICRSSAGSEDAIARIERDTNRVRKYIIRDHSLSSTKDFVVALDPLMPLDIESNLHSADDALDLLPGFLEDSTRPNLVKAAIGAYRDLRSPVEAIHKSLFNS